ncbi:MAG TPA: DNA repair exonuclease [Clostridiales bacterium UBA8153]|nr:DNA repair exonuclease [Clostridiales bacterium UBA8153]
MRILHLADLHLGWHPGWLGDRAKARQRERDSLLERAVDYAVASVHGIRLVIIAGDLFETHQPEPGLVGAVLRQLRRLEAAGVQLVTVPGNHDEITYHNSVYRVYGREWPGLLVENPHPEHVRRLDVGGETCHFYSLAYTGGITRAGTPLSSFPRRDEPGWHLASFHGSLDWNAGDRSLPLASSGLSQAQYDYVALGHLHGHRVAELGAGLAVYPGAVEGKGFNDPGVGCFTVADLRPGKVSVAKVPAGARAIITRTVGMTGGAGELETVISGLADREAMVRVVLTGAGAGEPDLEGLAGRLGPLFYHLELVDQTTVLSEDMLEVYARELTIRGLFVRRLQEKLAAATGDHEAKPVWRALRLGLASLQGPGEGRAR